MTFFPEKLSASEIDRYILRSAVVDSLTKNLYALHGRLLDIGCGKMPYREFILSNSKVKTYSGLDIEGALVYDQNVKPDFTWDGIKMPFENEQFDCAFGTEVLEHCPYPELVLKETYRVLKPGGVFFFTVPFLWNLHEVPYDEYRYTPFSLKRHLINSGFDQIEIYATGGWHLAMAQMIGLWLKRAPMAKRKSRTLKLLALPVMRYLIKIGKKEKVNFKEGQMITGLYGISRK